MQRKSFTAFEFKGDSPGRFRATFATLAPIVDHDGDVTLAGAFQQGQKVIISAYGHASWDGALPVGAGVIASNATKAWVDGEFFTNTAAGDETYKTVKALGPLAEFSYGYEVLDASFDSTELAEYPNAIRILKSLDVFEVSPVLKGAGIGTGLQSIKSTAVAARVSDDALKAARDQAELRQIWLEVASRQAEADDERKTVEYCEVPAESVDPVLHTVGNLVFAKACADLGVKDIELKWFERESLERTIARKTYQLDYGIAPSDDDDPVGKSFREEPIRGLTVKSLKKVWLRADVGFYDVIEAASHEVYHAAEPDDADHSKAYAYGEQWVAFAKGLVNSFDLADEKAAARQIIEALSKSVDDFIGDAVERQNGRPDANPPNPNFDALMGVDPNAPLREANPRPPSLGGDAMTGSPLAGTYGN